MARTNSLMNQKVLQEEYEESKIKLLMTNFAELEGKRLIEESKALSTDAFYLPTAKEKQRFTRRLNIYFAWHNLKKITRFAWPFHRSKIAALLVLLLMFFLGTTFISVEAFRVKVLNLFVQIEREFTAIRLDENSEQLPGHLHIEWDNAYAPTKIPVDYHISNVSNSENIKTIEYENENGGFIIFQQNHENSGINVDTEEADEVLYLTIHGQKGLFVRKKDMMTIVWHAEAHLFFITGNSIDLNQKKLIEIAESVSLIK